MRIVKLSLAILTTVMVNTFGSPLPELWSSLTYLQTRAQVLGLSNIAPSLNTITQEQLKSEIVKSLQNAQINNLERLPETQAVQTAKFLISSFFRDRITDLKELERTAHYILLVALITEFLKKHFDLHKPLTLLSINGMRDPIEYAYTIFALDKAGFENLELIILGDIQDPARIKQLKAYLGHERLNKKLRISTDIEYYATIEQLLTKNHHINLYLYKFRPATPLVNFPAPNGLVCTLQPSGDKASIYFLDKGSYCYLPNVQIATDFLVTQEVKSLAALNKFIKDMSYYPSPSEITEPDYECKPLEEETIYIFHLINKTKTKNKVPIFCYTGSQINFLLLSTNLIIDSIVSLIQTRINLFTGKLPLRTIYKWDDYIQQYIKYKDLLS